MQRLFVGIELPDAARRMLEPLRTEYPTARWHPSDAFHVTLSFIGHVDEQTGKRMAAALVGLPIPEMMLTLRGVGYFGSEHKPAVLWAGVETTDALLQLQKAVEQRLLPQGLVPEARPYRPHVTLARVRQGGNALRGFLEENADLAVQPFAVQHVSLFVSCGDTSGVRYEVIERFSLLKR